MTCAECQGPMAIDGNGIANHITGGVVDHDRDADHTPVDDADYGVI